MGGMAFTALKARNAAELSRSEAEKMVEFMLTDLRRDLDPIGKLDILDNVGKRVADYYDAIPTADMDDDRYARNGTPTIRTPYLPTRKVIIGWGNFITGRRNTQKHSHTGHHIML